MLTVPAVDAFQAPIGAQSAHATLQSAAPTSVVTTVKIGVRAVVTARMITIAETTSFADLLAIAIASQPVDERAKMAALPVMVHCARVLVLQGRHLPRHGRVPRRGAWVRGIACAPELPVVLPQVLQEGRDGARQVARAARAARAARGAGHEAGALTETHKHSPRMCRGCMGGLGRAGEGWGGSRALF